MILCVDIGNTTMSVALLNGTRTIQSWRIRTRERTPDEYILVLSSLLSIAGTDASGIDRAGVCSVVPSETEAVQLAIEGSLNVRVKMIDGITECGIDVAIENPREVGGDRIANAVGAFYLYGGDSIVIDLGTATTFDYVTALGEYRGGVIAPGLMAGARDLWRSARMLPEVEVKHPSRVIGANTIACMQAGIYFGTIGQIEGIVRRMQEEIGKQTRLIVTGGYSSLVHKDLGFDSHLDVDLTLRGIAFAVDPELRSSAGKGA